MLSFPHVEGPTSRKATATGRFDGKQVSVHAKTRLEEEIHLFNEIVNPVSLRVGMVYGNGILMIDAAKWFAKRRILGMWPEPTEIHLISKTDFFRAVVAAIRNENATGVFHIGNEGNDTLQSFLYFACKIWGQNMGSGLALTPFRSIPEGEAHKIKWVTQCCNLLVKACQEPVKKETVRLLSLSLPG